MENAKTKHLVAYVTVAMVGTLLLLLLILHGDARMRKLEKEKEKEELKDIVTLIDLATDGRNKEIRLRALQSVQQLDPNELPRDLARKRYILLGESLMRQHDAASNESDKQYYLDTAAMMYEQAGNVSSTIEEKNETIRLGIEILVDNGKWQDALDLYQTFDTELMSADERWRMMMKQAECLYHLGRYREYLLVLTQIIDAVEDQRLWGKAMLSRARLFIQASQDEAMQEAILSATSLSPSAAREKFRHLAFQDYRTIITNLTLDDKEASLAHLGLMYLYTSASVESFTKMVECFKRPEHLPTVDLLLCLSYASQSYNNASLAYDTANIMKRNQTWSEDCSFALLQLSRMERERARLYGLLGDVLKVESKFHRMAIEIDRKNLKIFPNSPYAPDCAYELYHLYMDNEDYDNAFVLLQRIFSSYTREDIIVKLVGELRPGRNRLMYHISQYDTIRKNKALEVIQDNMLTPLEVNSPKVWQKVKYDAQLVLAEIQLHSGKTNRAEKIVEDTLNDPSMKADLMEDFLYLDVLCSIDGRRPPVIAIIRCRRYLGSYPNGIHAQDVQGQLLAAYYNAGLYTEALNVTKQIYAASVKNRFQNNELFLRMLATTAQCYERLGDYTKAGNILSGNAKAFLQKSYAADVYLTWAREADKRGQVDEGVRRLSVVLPKVKDLDKRAEIWTLQQVMLLNAGDGRNYFKAQALLARLKNTEKLKPELKRRLLRTLTQSLLSYSFSVGMKEDFRDLLNYGLTEFPNESWTEYWALSSLTPLFGTTELKTLSHRHQQTLKEELKKGDANSKTALFLREQLKLINNLVSIEDGIETLKTERNLVPQ